jgi:ketosteroid isomerase-like protein
MKHEKIASGSGKMQILFPAILGAVFFLSACHHASEKQTSYAEERAFIEDLQARYMFALDNDDLDTYVSLFTKDGILDIGMGEWKGRDSIQYILESIPEEVNEEEDTTLHRTTGRHNISNIVVKIKGDTAWGRAYWFHMSNENPERRAQLNSYGHYEDVMVKVNGEWLFSKRKIYNEEIAAWAAREGNPCW